MKQQMAGDCKLLLILMATVLTRRRAVSASRPFRVLLDAGDCHLAQFKSLSPQELQAFKRAKDALVWERPVAIQAELALTLNILENVADPALGDILDQPLHTLHHIYSQLQACALAQPTAGPRPHSRHLSHLLHPLQEAVEKESPGCLRPLSPSTSSASSPRT